LKAVDSFSNRPTLQYTWFRYLPESIPDPFFREIEAQIIWQLKNVALFRSSRGTFHGSSEVVSVPDDFRDSDEHPLFHTNYLSEDYNISEDGHWFDLLGVKKMSLDDLLTGLRNMDKKDILRDQTDSWHEKVCQHLELVPNRVGQLRIIPLKSGSWATGEQAKRCVFDTDICDIPPGLGLESVISVKFRYPLLYKLGVRPADATLIAERILGLRSRSNVETRVKQTRFLFKHRHLISSSIHYKGLKVIDERCQNGYGHDMYVHVSESDGRFNLYDILPDSARFLHFEYYGVHGGLESEWIDWLCDIVRLNDAPRIIGGILSPEFEEMVLKLDSRDLLLVLKQYWRRIVLHLSKDGIRQLSQTEVECESGEVLPLKDTFLRKKTLARYNDALAFLPIDDPNEESWDFLGTLGVSTELDPPFLIKLLDIWQEKDEKDVPVENIYKQLDARFEQDEAFVL
jgi:hypothetical protein